MLSSPDLSFSRTLPLSIFNRLGELLHQMAQAIGSAALVLTEAVLARILIPVEWQQQRFTLVVSERFSALLLGKIEAGEEGSRVAQKEDVTLDSLNASLTFNSQAIAAFVSNLRNLFESHSYTYKNITQYQQVLAPNDATLQSKFTLLLLEYLLPLVNKDAQTSTISLLTEGFSCKPVEDALTKQIAQERLLNQVTTQIRKSLDLPVIMDTAITQVREFLELDRLVIYKFLSSPANTQNTSLNCQYLAPTVINSKLTDRKSVV